MSVMMVHSKTYVKVFNSLVLSQNWIVKQIVQNYGFVGVKKEIQKLYEANYQSYAERYKIPVEIEPLVISDKNFDKCESLCQLLKSLKCIEYQIELDEKKFDYKFLRKSISIITSAIIEGHPDYQSANWG
jgi:hypothetical protein